MKEKDPLNLRLLTDYLAGESTSEQQAEVVRWMAGHPWRAKAIEDLRALWARTRERGRPGVDVDRAVRAIEAYANTHRDIRSRVTPKRVGKDALLVVAQPRRVVRQSIRYALTVVVAVAMTMAVSWGVRTHRLSTPTVAPMATYVTAKGQRATIRLPDGSQVVLNVASRLDVPADYERGNHTVRLIGEALFTVMHHEGTPFTVVAGPSTTRVLGTSFIVRHYASDTLATIAVHDGKVAVRSTVVGAMQQVSFDQRGSTRVRPVDASRFSFASGVLTLTGVPLPDAISDLNRWYDADIRLGDHALTTRQVTGEFASGSLTDLSAILELMFNVRVVRDGRVLTLYPRG